MLETRHLFIRPWEETPEDAASLYTYASDPSIGPAAGWPPHESAEYSAKIIHNILATPGIYAVLPKSLGRPAGGAGLTWGTTGRKWLGEREAEIGYWIGRPFQGKGYAQEAVRLLLKIAFEEMNMKAVWAGSFEGNDISLHIQEKCGMKWHHTEPDTYIEKLGEYRTEHFTRITRKEWRIAGEEKA